MWQFTLGWSPRWLSTTSASPRSVLRWRSEIFFPPCPSVRTEIILWYRNAEFGILSPGPWIPSSSSTWPSCCLRPFSALSWSTPGKLRTSGTNLSTTKRLNKRETAARSVEWSHPGLLNAERYSWGNWTSPVVQRPVQWPQIHLCTLIAMYFCGYSNILKDSSPDFHVDVNDLTWLWFHIA